jgi:hypothetical protein
MNTVIKTTKNKAGTSLKNLAMINFQKLLCFKMLFVTTNPLIKKKSLTAKAPEYVKLKKKDIGSIQKKLSPFNVEECPKITRQAKIILIKSRLLLSLFKKEEIVISTLKV